MRPRLLRLGYRASYRDLANDRARFNEAEAFTPRICLDGHLQEFEVRARFNEAEAFTPRIPRRRATGTARRRRGFNEAEAFTPRIRGHHRDRRTQSGGASMRPRLLRLGYDTADALDVLAAEASMRPRLLRLGYTLDLESEPLVKLLASMRPRLLRLGYRLPDPGRGDGGKSFNEAEAFTPRIRCPQAPDRHAPGGASMRPRLLRLGYVTCIARPRARRQELQ